MEGEENLFLLEVMVNSVHYFNSVMDIDQELLACLGQTCINVKFMQFPPMTICEENFTESSQPFEDTDVILKSGKSILFPWKRSSRLSCADIKVVVSRKRGGPYSTDYIIGKTSIPLSSSVMNLLALPPQCGPGVKCVSGTYDIKNRCCNTVANISLFIRLSSYGNLIVTKFLLKDADKDNLLYRGGSDIFKTIEDTIPCPMDQPPKLDCAPVELEPYPYPKIADNFCQPKPQSAPCQQAPAQPCTPISAAPRKQVLPPQPQSAPYPFCQRITIGEPPSSSSSECSEPPQPQLPFNLCDCDFPVPPGLACPPCPPKKKKKKKREACCPLEPQPGDYCLRADCPCGLQQPPWLVQAPVSNVPGQQTNKLDIEPGGLAFRGKQAVIPFGDHSHAQNHTDVRNFAEAPQVKMGVADGERGQRNVVSVTPDVRDMQPDPIPDKDVFVLHIGKPSPASMAKMEITLESPKYRDNRPQMADCETQYLEEDVGEVQKGGSKAGKGDKGSKKNGKGKKGKK